MMMERLGADFQTKVPSSVLHHPLTCKRLFALADELKASKTRARRWAKERRRKSFTPSGDVIGDRTDVDELLIMNLTKRKPFTRGRVGRQHVDVFFSTGDDNLVQSRSASTFFFHCPIQSSSSALLIGHLFPSVGRVCAVKRDGHARSDRNQTVPSFARGFTKRWRVIGYCLSLSLRSYSNDIAYPIYSASHVESKGKPNLKRATQRSTRPKSSFHIFLPISVFGQGGVPWMTSFDSSTTVKRKQNNNKNEWKTSMVISLVF